MITTPLVNAIIHKTYTLCSNTMKHEFNFLSLEDFNRTEKTLKLNIFVPVFLFFFALVFLALKPEVFDVLNIFHILSLFFGLAIFTSVILIQFSKVAKQRKSKIQSLIYSVKIDDNGIVMTRNSDPLKDFKKPWDEIVVMKAIKKSISVKDGRTRAWGRDWYYGCILTCEGGETIDLDPIEKESVLAFRKIASKHDIPFENASLVN